MLRLGGGSASARQAHREMWASLYVWSVSFRTKREIFLGFPVVSGNFHLSLPNFSIWTIFDFIFYFLWIFWAKKSKKCSILTYLRLKMGIKWSLFDLIIGDHVYGDIKLSIGYCTYFIGSSFDFLIVKYLFFT